MHSTAASISTAIAYDSATSSPAPNSPGLGARGRPAMLGYVFDGSWAARNRDAISRFIEVTRKAKEIIATLNENRL